MKRCKIRIEHSTHPPFKLQIRPNTRVSDVLSYLNLTEEDYVLQLLSDPTKTFTSEEDLYEEITNDQKLIATLSPEVAEIYAHTFFQ